MLPENQYANIAKMPKSAAAKSCIAGFLRSLASIDRCSEDVTVLAVIVAELELGDIQWHVFGAHLVERAHHAALEDRPEAFDGLCMDSADNVLSLGVVNGRVRKILSKAVITGPLIGAEQAHLVRYSFPYEFLKRAGLEVFDNAGDDVALAADSANDRRLAGTNAARAAALPALVPMLVFGESADERFIDLDNAAELANVHDHSRSDFVAHRPRCFIGTEAHETFHLKGRYAFLAGYHEMNNTKPIPQRFVRVFKDGSSNMREAVAGRATRSALGALPVPFARRKVVDRRVVTTRAMNAIRPTAGDQIGSAGIFVWEQVFELGYRKLLDRLGLLAAHGFSLSVEGYCHV